MRLSLKPPAWMMALAMRYVPFADAVSHDLPLGRLLRLSLFQAAIGITLALLVGTLNRVMIVELGCPPGGWPCRWRCPWSLRPGVRSLDTAATPIHRLWGCAGCRISGLAAC